MILLGQLADELFGGYRKYARQAEEGGPMRRRDMMARGRQGLRGQGVPQRRGGMLGPWAEVRFPYADGGIARFAAALPLDYKIRERRAQSRPPCCCAGAGAAGGAGTGPKKAAQFSSGAAKLLLKTLDER